MRLFQRRYLFLTAARITALAALAAVAFAPWAAAQRAPAAPPHPTAARTSTAHGGACDPSCPTITQFKMYEIPNDVRYTDNGPAPVDIPGGLDLYQSYLQQFGWQSFIALNWPVDRETNRADPRTVIGAAPGDAEPVWQRWSNADDVFRPGGAEPLPFGVPTPIPDACRALLPADYNDKRDPRVIVLTDDDETFTAHNLPHPDPIRLVERRSPPVVDQAGRWVRFEIYMNEVTYNYIKDNHLYSREGQRKFADSKTPLVFPAGAIEIKAAWRVLDDKSDADRSALGRYHTATALFPSRAGCKKATVGLVAYHIMHKTPRNLNRVWSTFEHVDNLCQRSWTTNQWVGGSFCDAKCMSDPAAPGCPKPNTAPPKPWLPPADPTAPRPRAAKSQLVRDLPMPVAVGQLNSLMQALLLQLGERDAARQSVWQYYQLIDVQWMMPLMSNVNTSVYRAWLAHPDSKSRAPQIEPRLPDDGTCNSTPPCCDAGARCPGVVTPTLVANTIVEAYEQPTSSCMGCHGQARTTAKQDANFSFLLVRAQEATSAAPPTTPRPTGP